MPGGGRVDRTDRSPCHSVAGRRSGCVEDCVCVRRRNRQGHSVGLEIGSFSGRDSRDRTRGYVQATEHRRRPPAEADTAVIHAHGEDLVGAALIVRAATYGTLRDELSRRINGPVPSDFSLAAYLLERGAVDVVLDRPTVARPGSGRKHNTGYRGFELGNSGVVVVNLDLDIDRWKASWHRFIRLPGVAAVERVSAFRGRAESGSGLCRLVRVARSLGRPRRAGIRSLIAADDVSLLDAASLDPGPCTRKSSITTIGMSSN